MEQNCESHESYSWMINVIGQAMHNAFVDSLKSFKGDKIDSKEYCNIIGSTFACTLGAMMITVYKKCGVAQYNALCLAFQAQLRLVLSYAKLPFPVLDDVEFTQTFLPAVLKNQQDIVGEVQKIMDSIK